MSSGKIFTVSELGVSPQMTQTGRLSAGEVGYVIAGMKDVKETRIGDTITTARNPAREALPGYRRATPMVYCGFYPTDNGDYEACAMP